MLSRSALWALCAVLLSLTIGCAAPHRVRRVANVPPATGTPSSGLALGNMNVRMAVESFPMHGFMETKERQRLGDTGLSVQTTQLGGSLRLGLGDSVNIGLRFDSGFHGVNQKSHLDVAPAPSEPARGFAVEVESSWQVSERGYLGLYVNAGLWEIPYAVYEDFEGDDIYIRTGSDTAVFPSLHLALMGGARWDWVAVYAGVNIQTGFQNEGYTYATSIGQAIRATSTEAESTVDVVFHPPTVFVGAEVLGFGFLTLGVQAWYTLPLGDRPQAIPGVGAWLAFNTGGL